MTTLLLLELVESEDTRPRDRCGRAQLALLPSLADFLHLGADLYTTAAAPQGKSFK